jgi:putative ABC transport system ATP-binding protein
MLKIKDVTKKFKLGDEVVHALNNLSLEINEGTFLAIMGPSGSGKSTLAHIIGGLESVDSGVVEINGEDISTLKDKKISLYRNKTIGFIFQSFNLLPNLTALENVSMPLAIRGVSEKERDTKAKKALEVVGLSNREKHLPSQLSGGQRQRVAIARALVTSPSLLIADEPTGNLDSSKGNEIMELLKKLNTDQKLTIILITHDMNTAQYANKIITVKDGSIVR